MAKKKAAPTPDYIPGEGFVSFESLELFPRYLEGMAVIWMIKNQLFAQGLPFQLAAQAAVTRDAEARRLYWKVRTEGVVIRDEP